MSQSWIEHILRRKDLKGPERLCAMVIANCANYRTDECFPGLKKIAEDMNCSTRNAQDLIHRLVEKKVFKITEGQGRGHMMVFELIKGEETFVFNGNEKTQKVSPIKPTKDEEMFIFSEQEKVKVCVIKGEGLRKEKVKVCVAPLNKDEHLLEQSINKEEGTLLGETQKLIGFPLDNHTAERILAVIDSRFEKQWLDLVSNRMLGLRDAHKNYIQTRIGYWLSDYQNNLWRFEKDAERKNGTSQKLSERDKSAQRTINAERMANAIATGDEAALRDILGGDGQDHSSGYLPS